MNTTTLKLSVIALAPAAMLILASCSSTPSGERTTVTTAEQGVPGGVMVDTYKTTATVTGIDATKRVITLVSPEGKKTDYKAGPEVINFDQIHVGDQLKITATEELVVYLAGAGVRPSIGGGSLVTLAPKGAKPGGFMAETVQVTAQVKAIDLKKHKATLQFPDGTTHTVAVRKDVDLTKRQVGEQVVIRSTGSIALSVEKP